MSKVSYCVTKNSLTELQLTAMCNLPTKFSKDKKIQMMTFDYGDIENAVIALIYKGNDFQPNQEPLVRLHSACVTSEIFGSQKCDCSQQFNQAMRKICDGPYGIMLYLTNHEGRGIGLKNKILAYQLQEKGADTLKANELLGFPHDMRDFQAAVKVLNHLQVSSLRLLTNNPDKVSILHENGICVSQRISISSKANRHNRDYLVLKQNLLNHNFGVIY